MPEMTDEWLALRLKRLLDGREISTKEAAEAIGVPYRTLQNQLAGNNKMAATTLAKLLMMLQVPVEFLVEERIRLKPRALAFALDRTFGPALPTFISEGDFMGPALPSVPDPRGPQERFDDARSLALILRGDYEMAALDPRDMDWINEAEEEPK